MPTEHLWAEKLIRDAQEAWPGSIEQRWSKWLGESIDTLALRTRVTELTLDQALHLAQDGALLIGGFRGGRTTTLLLGSDGRTAEVAAGEIDERQHLSRAELREAIAEADDGHHLHTWLVVEHPELYDTERARKLHDRPVERLLEILRPEWSDIWLILLFAFVAGVLNLATPIAVEALVNTVAFGRLLQSLVVLAILLLGFLALAGVMQVLQSYLAEIIQRRLFARVAADLAYRLPRVNRIKLTVPYGPELVNRFLEIVMIQKVVAIFLLDGVNVVMATLVGMTVLAFYHPWLLGFDVLLLLLVTGGLYLLGRGGIGTAIDESKIKYRLVAWLEDIMRCEGGFKADGGADFAMDRANLITSHYLSARRSHFRILLRQLIFLLGLQAVAGTTLLAGGGWLVIQGQLSLGQLVAAELIVTNILVALTKSGKHIERFFDVVASVDKLGILLDLEEERHDGLLTLPDTRGLSVRLTDVRSPVEQSVLKSGLTATIEPGEKVAVLGAAGTGKTTLLRMLFASAAPIDGHVEVGQADPLDVRPDILRSQVAYAGPVELFEASLADNVHLRRPGLAATHVRSALESVGLLEDVLRLPDGLEAKLNATGRPLSQSKLSLLMLSRAIIGSPKLLLVDGVLDHLPDRQFHTALAALLDPEHSWTLLLATGRQDVAAKFNRVICLDASPA